MPMTPPEPRDSELDCARAREAILEAEPQALRTGDAGSLGRHLAACPRCRAEALRIVRFTGALATRLASPPALEAQAVVRAAGHPSHHSSRHRRLIGVGLPLAAAAGLATLLFVGREAGNDRLFRPPAAGEPPIALATPVVEFTSPPDRNAVVLQTRNPDITVIWLYGESP
jgi:anti-sigma factor RsiW